MRLNPALLKSKGWDQSEIEHASKVIDAAETRKHTSLVLLDHSVYWILLFIVLLGNAAAALFLLPIAAFLPGSVVYFIVGILGVCFGSLFTLIIRDIEKAKKTHHVLAGIIIPLIGILTFITMMETANTQGIRIATHSTIGVSLMYVALFLLPYLFFLTEERFELFDATT